MASAGVWVKAPGGVFPDPDTGPVTNYGSESECGTECYDLKQSDGSLLDFREVKIEAGKAVADSQKKSDRQAAKQAAKDAKQSARAARKARIQAADTALKQLIKDMADDRSDTGLDD